jgi:hypothetical protein
MKSIRLCVCGGRNYGDKEKVYRVLNKLLLMIPPHKDVVLVHGGASGADTLASQWATMVQIKQECFMADWQNLGKKAGIVRNRKMLDSGIDFLVAFPGGKGTENMITIAQKAGIRAMVVKD